MSTTVTEYVDKDAWAWQQFPTTNMEAENEVRVGENPAGYRNWSYMKFNFDDVAVPADATIIFAKLNIYVGSILSSSFVDT